MRILLIGGTGTISSAITRQLAASGHDLWLLNRGSRKNEVPSLVERDIKLFRGRTKQYVFISSASAYHKPAASHVITEGTALANPYWQYSRDKIACEERRCENMLKRDSLSPSSGRAIPIVSVPYPSPFMGRKVAGRCSGVCSTESLSSCRVMAPRK
ncbi:MAG: hypothetical protein IJ551_09095 [Prevotella sp.]|nr:hypothetical protein [Prevotella sp.]MBQ8712952.1 hypothetical protein [Prevotella sp.]